MKLGTRMKLGIASMLINFAARLATADNQCSPKVTLAADQIFSPQTSVVGQRVRARLAETFGDITTELIVGATSKNIEKTVDMVNVLHELSELVQDIQAELQGLSDDNIKKDCIRVRRLAMDRIAQSGWREQVK